jgi:flagellar biosynthesis/type III secretory pathway protein FliH
MIATEWNLEDAIKVAQEEAWEDGRKEGWDKGREDGWEECREKDRKLFSGLVEQAKSMEDLRQMFAATFTRQS